MTDKKHDTRWTDFPVCPHCGHKHVDDWEYWSEDDDDDTECEDCGEPFYFTVSVSVNFTTKTMEEVEL